MELNWNFLRCGGGELKPKTFPGGCMDSFWNNTIYGSHILADCVLLCCRTALVAVHSSVKTKFKTMLTQIQLNRSSQNTKQN